MASNATNLANPNQNAANQAALAGQQNQAANNQNVQANGQQAAAPNAQQAGAQPAQQQAVQASNVRSFDKPQLVRSNLIHNSDRYGMETDLKAEHGPKMHNLKSGGGILGLENVSLVEMKEEKLGLKNSQLAGDKKIMHSNKQILEKLRDDGIYVDDPEVRQKFTDINIQKLEERLLSTGAKQFFKMNGELKLDNDLLADELTRPADLAFEQSVAFQRMEVNSVLSDRANSFKRQYFRLDIVIGKVTFNNYKKLIAKEDKCAMAMKQMFIDWEHRTSLMMIPLFTQQRDFIKEKIASAEHPRSVAEDPVNTADKQFLKQNLEDVQEKLEKEQKEIQALAEGLLKKWEELQAIRKENTFKSTSLDLKVQMIPIESDKSVEYQFALFDTNIDTKLKFDSKGRLESSRRSSISGIKAYGRLHINGNPVAETKKKPMSFPQFEIDMAEMFQVNVFTMPSSIFLELIIQEGLRSIHIGNIELEVPGHKVEFEKSKIVNKVIEQANKPDDKLTPAQEAKIKAQEEKQKQKDEDLKAGDIKGFLYAKCEWKGTGPHMPPIKHENLFRKPKTPKNRNELSAQEQSRLLWQKMYIDVNDPRNEQIITLLKETKNEFLVKLLKDDARNQLWDCEPFRHKLLQARVKDPVNQHKFVPMLENEVIDSTRTNFYLEWLEKLFRDEAYLRHLEKRADTHDTERSTGLQTQIDQDAIVDLSTLRRRHAIYDQMKDRAQRRATQQSSSTGTNNYKNIIKEFPIDAGTNPFIGILNRFFIQGRKLKPAVQQREVVPFEGLKNVNMYIHIIKAENVPVRRQIVEDWVLALKAEKEKNNQTQALSRRPVANLPNDPYAGLNAQGMIVDEDVPANVTLRNKDELYNTAQVETYVEVRVQYHEKYAIVHRTNVDEGYLPKWNEVLTFPLVSENAETGFTQAELQSTHTQIIISLFDKQTFNSQKDGQNIQTEENRFLGNVTIPLSSILMNHDKMDFNFRLNRPLVLPAYRITNDDVMLIQESQLDDEALRRKEQLPTYLNLSISLDPAIELPSENMEAYYPGGEKSTLLLHGSEWVHALQTKKKAFQKRSYRVFGEDLGGYSRLLCRFLTMQRPPPELFENDQNVTQNKSNAEIDAIIAKDKFAIEKAARFVSLIPYVEDMNMFGVADMPDMYCTSQEFLDLGGGDHEEHAILLCNYFKYIDNLKNKDEFESFIVFAEALPQGDTVYVMRRNKVKLQRAAPLKPVEAGSIELWQPMTGEMFFFERKTLSAGCMGGKAGSHMDTRQDDPICPLKHIYCLVGEQNVYANIQTFDFPIGMDFDIENPKMWKKLFDKHKKLSSFEGTEKLAPLQQLIPLTSAPRKLTDTRKLASQIQKFLVTQFQDERIKQVKKTTKWLVSADAQLKQLLEDCEAHAKNTIKGGVISRFNPHEKETGLKIETIRKAFDDMKDQKKRVWGFPLNFTFVSLDHLWLQVAATKVHCVNRRDVEFALAVVVESYPANVLSIWVYLAAFVDKEIMETTADRR